jgi:membrane protein required for colicin V production
MTVVDVILIIVIILSALFSLMRGFVREAISLATWVIAIWIAATFTPKLAAELPGGIESEAVRQAIGFGILFVLSLMVGALINSLISHLVKKTGLSGADRVFGVIFGILRGGLIILVFVVIGGMTPLPEEDWWQSSVLLKWFESTAMVIQDYIPQDLGISYQPVSQ